MNGKLIRDIALPGDAYNGDPQNVANKRLSSKTFDRPKSAI